MQDSDVIQDMSIPRDRQSEADFDWSFFIQVMQEKVFRRENLQNSLEFS